LVSQPAQLFRVEYAQIVRAARWKSLEAALACVGSVADTLLEMRDEESNEGVSESFDLEHLFKEVVPKLLNTSGKHDLRLGAIASSERRCVTDSPFLQGRAFVFASQYVLTLAEAGISRQYLEAAVQALEAGGVETVVKISAIKTIRKCVASTKDRYLLDLKLTRYLQFLSIH
jgi:hypothetical protein